jgi:hypothetical protein
LGLGRMSVDDTERFNAIQKLVDEYGYPNPCYCTSCKKPIGYYFKKGSERWDGKPANLLNYPAFWAIEFGVDMLVIYYIV